MREDSQIGKITFIIDELLNDVFIYLGHKYRDKPVNKNTEYFFFLLLHKLSDNLFTANILLKKLNKFPQIHGGVCLILRTCLSDTLIFHHLCLFIEDGQKDNDQLTFQDRVKDMWGDHLKFIIDYNQKKASWGYLDKINKENERLLINKHFNDYFETPLDISWNYKLKRRDRFSIEKIINEKLAKNTLVFKAYELYQIYSKLEHNGEFTDEIHNWIYNNKENAVENLLASFSIAATTVIQISQALFAGIDGTKEKFEILKNKLDSLAT